MCDDGSSSSHLVFLPRAGCDIGNDKEWDIALEEATITATTSELTKVSEQTWIPNYRVDTPELQGYVLYEIEAILNGFGKSMKDFGLPTPPRHLLEDLENKLLMEEKNYRRELLMQEMLQSLPKICTLTENMRLLRPVINEAKRKKSQEFAKWLLNVGNGELGEPDEEDTS
ncbi:DNA helicase [Tanacetum coccineum]